MRGMFLGLFLLFAGVCQAEFPIIVENAMPKNPAVATGYNQSAWNLYRQLSVAGGNVLVSPYSIGMAMSMALSGAKGDTKLQMQQVLHLSMNDEELHQGSQKLLRDMGRFASDPSVEMTVANALFINPDFELVSPEFVSLLSQGYEAEIFREQNLDLINAWVNQKTKTRIPKILDRLHQNSVAVILNAVYFKSNWAVQFDKEMTEPLDFFVNQDEVVQVPMMQRTDHYSLVYRDSYQALRMPYVSDDLSMVVILPMDKTGLTAFEESFNPYALQEILQELRDTQPSKVKVGIPRFRVEYSAALVEPYQNMGMKDAFSSSDADFGGITGQENAKGLIWIDQIQHKTFLEVNEEGSEAAAATAVAFATRSMAMTPEFIADRPFLYLIEDRGTGMILFMGRMANPLE
ncbi:MAG: serpin family protein [Candidatus Cloacimonetes bacterium]|nr:serpin family protein [Candidatus Cloacimonadota bacterium]